MSNYLSRRDDVERWMADEAQRLVDAMKKTERPANPVTFAEPKDEPNDMANPQTRSTVRATWPTR